MRVEKEQTVAFWQLSNSVEKTLGKRFNLRNVGCWNIWQGKLTQNSCQATEGLNLNLLMMLP